MSKIKCPKCGKKIDDNVAFCSFCGAKISDNPSEPEKKSGSGMWALMLTMLVLAATAAYLYRDHIVTLLHNEAVERQQLEADPLPISPDEARAILLSTLNNENRMGDRASAMYALEVPKGMTQGCRKIIGLTSLSNPSGRSFCKVYSMREDSLGWHIDDCQSIFFDNRVIITDPAEIMGSNNAAVPQITSIDGKNYFFFAYAAMPMVVGSDSFGKASFALLNIDSPAIIVSLDFEGEIRDKDGKQTIVGNLTNGRDTPEARFLLAQSRQASIIYQLSPEEAELEKPENAIRLWQSENVENMRALRESPDGVKMAVKLYSKPIFTSEDITNGARIDTGAYVVLADGHGNVYGFRKSDKRYFVIFAPFSTSDIAAEIAANADGTVHIALPSIEMDFDLATFLAVAI